MTLFRNYKGMKILKDDTKFHFHNIITSTIKQQKTTLNKIGLN